MSTAVSTDLLPIRATAAFSRDIPLVQRRVAADYRRLGRKTRDAALAAVARIAVWREMDPAEADSHLMPGEEWDAWCEYVDDRSGG